MKIRKITGIVFIILLLTGTVMGMTGCNSRGKLHKMFQSTADSIRQEENENKPKGEYRVGVSFGNIENDFENLVCQEMQKYAEKRGILLTVLNASGSREKQITDIQEMLTDELSALIISPLDSIDLIVTETGAEGVPVFLLYSAQESTNVIAASVVDHFSLGVMSGEFLLDSFFPESEDTDQTEDDLQGVILELQGTEGKSFSEERSLGFESVFDGITGVKIVRSSYCGSDREKAEQIVESVVATNNILGIFTVSDELALGASDALQKLEMTEIPICSVDGKMEAVKQVKEENILCTVTCDPVRYAHLTLNHVISFLNGDETESYITLPSEVICTENAGSYLDESREYAKVKKLGNSEEETDSSQKEK